MQKSLRDALNTRLVLGMAGEPDTRKRVCPVRRKAYGNLVWKQIKALYAYPIGVNKGNVQGQVALVAKLFGVVA